MYYSLLMEKAWYNRELLIDYSSVSLNAADYGLQGPGVDNVNSNMKTALDYYSYKIQPNDVSFNIQISFILDTSSFDISTYNISKHIDAQTPKSSFVVSTSDLNINVNAIKLNADISISTSNTNIFVTRKSLSVNTKSLTIDTSNFSIHRELITTKKSIQIDIGDLSVSITSNYETTSYLTDLNDISTNINKKHVDISYNVSFYDVISLREHFISCDNVSYNVSANDTNITRNYYAQLDNVSYSTTYNSISRTINAFIEKASYDIQTYEEYISVNHVRDTTQYSINDNPIHLNINHVLNNQSYDIQSYDLDKNLNIHLQSKSLDLNIQSASAIREHYISCEPVSFDISTYSSTLAKFIDLQAIINYAVDRKNINFNVTRKIAPASYDINTRELYLKRELSAENISYTTSFYDIEYNTLTNIPTQSANYAIETNELGIRLDISILLDNASYDISEYPTYRVIYAPLNTSSYNITERNLVVQQTLFYSPDRKNVNINPHSITKHIVFNTENVSYNVNTEDSIFSLYEIINRARYNVSTYNAQFSIKHSLNKANYSVQGKNLYKRINLVSPTQSYSIDTKVLQTVRKVIMAKKSFSVRSLDLAIGLREILPKTNTNITFKEVGLYLNRHMAIEVKNSELVGKASNMKLNILHAKKMIQTRSINVQIYKTFKPIGLDYIAYDLVQYPIDIPYINYNKYVKIKAYTNNEAIIASVLSKNIISRTNNTTEIGSTNYHIIRSRKNTT